MANEKSIYDFQLPGISGKETIDFSSFRDKNILIVNTASACGYTYQYEQLQSLYSDFKEDLIVIGVPSNEFGNQEAGTEEEILEFCSSNYSVKFPMAQKTSVTGNEIHPVFDWLVNHPANDKGDIKWNFHKFFIDKKGKLVAHLPSNVEPYSDSVIDLIE